MKELTRFAAFSLKLKTANTLTKSMDKRTTASLKKYIISKSTLEFTNSEKNIYELLYSHESFFQIRPLVKYTLERAKRVNQLSKQGSTGDAEIIFRSMLEGFIKLIYIITSENDQVYQHRINEYFTILCQIETLRTSDKHKILSESKINSRFNPYAALVLSEEEEQELKQKPSWANRKYRQEVKAKWSYSELSKYLSSNLQGGFFVPFRLLDHYYKLASHIAHGDETIFRNQWMIPFMEKEYMQLIQTGNTTKLLRIVNELIFWIGLELAKFSQKEETYNTIYDHYKDYYEDTGNIHDTIIDRIINYGK
ncbi:hypothetical protein F0P96_11085 [Hymenobacter busanensis]|uniref:Uncharacterized protein n=1 Tax=Hymenobacter busanensis TaxID=2607656 RepID=A0A7L4ZW12_9BACT|nr:DUF5677 domain-containing protein [Hymenobacter busanensis]KAA9332029.1 hypothetical protein F0P96_11085 [Hymenobacter busanensis]QHJ07634.1 hypothetical protein GUY19_10190 [Hymenobacter busanensis]